MKMLFLFLSLISFHQYVLSQEVEGFVKDSSGKFLKDVEVGNTKTNEKGFFKTAPHKGYQTYKDGKAVLFFEKKGYASQAQVIDFTEKEIIVEMQEDNLQEISSIKTCGDIKNKNVVGNVFKLFVPRGAKKKNGFDVDYGYYSIGFVKTNQKQYLSGIYQLFPMGNPNPDWIKNSRTISFSRWQNDAGINGVSWFGETNDGEFWRYFAFNFLGSEIVEYKINSKEAKEYFDKIIDNGCIEIPNWVRDGKGK